MQGQIDLSLYRIEPTSLTGGCPVQVFVGERRLKTFKRNNGVWSIYLGKRQGFHSKKIISIAKMLALKHLPPQEGEKYVVVLDGDHNNLQLSNIAWSKSKTMGRREPPKKDNDGVITDFTNCPNKYIHKRRGYLIQIGHEYVGTAPTVERALEKRDAFLKEIGRSLEDFYPGPQEGLK